MVNPMSSIPVSWRDTLISEEATLSEVIGNLNATGLQVVLVHVDGILKGTVTDGDIRRALLRGLDLSSPARDVMFRTPLTATPEQTRDAILRLMAERRIHQIPIVEPGGRILGLHVWDDLLPGRNARPNTVVIMAGGFGKRLAPHTDTIPKPMVHVGGRPMLEHIVDALRDSGFTNIVVALHHLGHIIEDHFGGGERFGVRIRYLKEEEPLGTAGALSLLTGDLDAPLIVTNGDLLTDIRYGEMVDFHQSHNATASMAVRMHEIQNPFGVVDTEGVDIVGFEEKPIHRTRISAGVYVLDPDALSLLQKGQYCDMPTLFERLRQAGRRTIAYAIYEPWIDIGRPEDLERAKAHKGE